MQYLITACGRRTDGAIPQFLLMATFERTWIATNAARLGIPLPSITAERLERYFAAELCQRTVPMGPGLPGDADITSAMLFYQGLNGASADASRLLSFETPDSFANYPAERTPSTTTNAHILEALAVCARSTSPDSGDPLTGARTKARDYLLTTQATDGSWTDKWHASPHYATACAATALDHWGGPAATRAVNHARRWTLDSQNPDGSWGQWGPTLDETAHSLYQLVATQATREHPSATAAIGRGSLFLTNAQDASPTDPLRTPLWHSKELYEPPRILTALIATVLGSIRTPNSEVPGNRTTGLPRGSKHGTFSGR